MSKTTSGKNGGILKGKKHSECDDNGCGIKAVVDGTKTVELESGEVILSAKAMSDSEVMTVTGTKKEIASKINSDKGYGVKFEEGGEVKPTFKTGGGLTDHKETYKKWKTLVNMSYSELKKFYDSEEGRKAGLKPSEAKAEGIDYGRESARWILKMKKTPVNEWTSTMWKWANKQISFISRMSGNKGDLYDEKGNKTRKHLSLLIWGHNPEKYDKGGPVKNNKEIMSDFEKQLEKGVATEMEHLDTLKKVESGETSATEGVSEIAKDHIVDEKTNYYTELKKVEGNDVGEFKPSGIYNNIRICLLEDDDFGNDFITEGTIVYNKEGESKHKWVVTSFYKHGLKLNHEPASLLTDSKGSKEISFTDLKRMYSEGFIEIEGISDSKTLNVCIKAVKKCMDYIDIEEHKQYLIAKMQASEELYAKTLSELEQIKNSVSESKIENKIEQKIADPVSVPKNTEDRENIKESIAGLEVLMSISGPQDQPDIQESIDGLMILLEMPETFELGGPVNIDETTFKNSPAYMETVESLTQMGIYDPSLSDSEVYSYYLELGNPKFEDAPEYFENGGRLTPDAKDLIGKEVYVKFRNDVAIVDGINGDFVKLYYPEAGFYEALNYNVNEIIVLDRAKTLAISEKNPLSSQLSKITGDPYNTQDYVNLSGLGLNSKFFKHIKTGQIFRTINKTDYDEYTRLYDKYSEVYSDEKNPYERELLKMKLDWLESRIHKYERPD